MFFLQTLKEGKWWAWYSQRLLLRMKRKKWTVGKLKLTNRAPVSDGPLNWAKSNLRQGATKYYSEWWCETRFSETAGEKKRAAGFQNGIKSNPKVRFCFFSPKNDNLNTIGSLMLPIVALLPRPAKSVSTSASPENFGDNDSRDLMHRGEIGFLMCKRKWWKLCAQCRVILRAEWRIIPGLFES